MEDSCLNISQNSIKQQFILIELVTLTESPHPLPMKDPVLLVYKYSIVGIRTPILLLLLVNF